MATSLPHPSSPEYLTPTAYLDSDHPDVLAYADRVTAGHDTPAAKAIALYLEIRDQIRYDPYRMDLSPEAMRASAVIERGFGFCIPKAVLLAATARAQGIPTRLGFADVKNHLATEKLLRLMQTEVFAYHGYAELWLHGKWVKATPAFNASLCERFDVPPLEFDGANDSVLQPFDRKGNRYMEYLEDHGQFVDLPLQRMLDAFHQHYPALMTATGYDLSGDFEREAVKQ